MPAIRKKIPAAKIARARRMYERTAMPRADIAKFLAMSPRTLSKRIHEWGWTPRQPRTKPAAAMPRERAAGRPATGPVQPPATAAEALPAEAGAPPSAAQARLSLTERIHAAAESQIGAVETILKRLGGDDVENETAARALATIARTLRELMAFDTAQSGDTAHDAPVPRSLDELRRSLAEKIDRIIADRANSAHSEAG
jgi:hypothetical protein